MQPSAKIAFTVVAFSIVFTACSAPDGGFLSSDDHLAAPAGTSLSKIPVGYGGEISFAPTGTLIVHPDGSSSTAQVGDWVEYDATVKNTLGSRFKLDVVGAIHLETDPTIAVTIQNPVAVEFWYHQAWAPVNEDMTVYTNTIRVQSGGSCTLFTKSTTVLRSGFNENE
ncbi:MAG: hypothetical protein D6762_06500 [Candidatus Neomarinimicrobiota bacterium]|nr:MAG: hypothetical protein D6762_06500 [Candidatus Neomarinimicrobiota bacterium]